MSVPLVCSYQTFLQGGEKPHGETLKQWQGQPIMVAELLSM